MGMFLSLVQFTPEKLREYLDFPEHFKSDLPDLENSKDDPSCYFDKVWEGIHYLLTGTPMDGYMQTGIQKTDSQSPLSLAIYSDQFFDKEQDLGIGPASYITPDQVKQISAIISALDSSFWKERYNPSKMNEIGIYPRFWNDDSVFINFLDKCFKELKNFYEDAASKGHAAASYFG